MGGIVLLVQNKSRHERVKSLFFLRGQLVEIQHLKGKICNVGVPELVRGYMEVQTIHMVWEAFPMASENGVGHITDVFSVHIFVADFLSCGVTFNMVPNTHKFPLRKGAALTI